MRKIELLAPAKDTVTAREAIIHGADAVYIGASSHGARKSAANDVEDIRSLVDFAHQYRARIYVTVNTLVYDSEIKNVEELVWDLYRAGVDALIVQDMGLLRMNIPPIELHASTQCDTRFPDKARFLQEVGFSQLVLARELTLGEIENICRSVSVPVECFVHGALCVSYSGRCHASFATNGRSANRGECSQICRLPFTLTDAKGRTIVRNKHLLSLRDFNASEYVGKMMRAGVSSFKIEGRLKDIGYVKNVTAYYRKVIDREITLHPEEYCRASFGETELQFVPDVKRSFNRGFTDYFLNNRRPASISSSDTPKSWGVDVTDFRTLKNGDGISFFDRNGVYTGAFVNGINRDGSIRTSAGVTIPKGKQIRLTFDKEWEKMLSGRTAQRRIGLKISLSRFNVAAEDERGNRVILPINLDFQVAKKAQDFRTSFEKLGNTIYRLDEFKCTLPDNMFVPVSQLVNLRREITRRLDAANRMTYPTTLRRRENADAVYPEKHLTYADNVSNCLAEQFYSDHGVSVSQPALEVSGRETIDSDAVLMTTRHCILREIGLCLRQRGNIHLPLKLKNGNREYGLSFDCSMCEMHVTYSGNNTINKARN